MPTLRELRAEKSRSAVSRTISCRSARERRAGTEPSTVVCRGRAAAVTGPMVQHTVTERSTARRVRRIRPLRRANAGTAGVPGAPVTFLDGPVGESGTSGSGPADAARVGQQPDRRCLLAARLAVLGAVRVLVVHPVLAVVVLHEPSFPLVTVRETASGRDHPF